MRLPCATALAGARHVPGAWLILVTVMLGSRVGAADPILVKVDKGAVSLTAWQQPRSLVLRQLLAACGLAMPQDPDLTGNVTLQLNRVTLDQALRQLLPGRSFVLRYDRSGIKSNRLWLLGSGASASQIATAAHHRPSPWFTELNHPDPLQRVEVVARFAEQSDLGAVEAALGDPDPRVREAAVEGLWDIGDERAYQLLVLALEDPVDAVSNEAAEALSALGPADP